MNACQVFAKRIVNEIGPYTLAVYTPIAIGLVPRAIERLVMGTAGLPDEVLGEAKLRIVVIQNAPSHELMPGESPAYVR
jgi:hypothetical protein